MANEYLESSSRTIPDFDQLSKDWNVFCNGEKIFYKTPEHCSPLSFINAIDGEIAKDIIITLSSVQSILYEDLNLPCCLLFKQINNDGTLKKVITGVKEFNVVTEDDKNVQAIYLFILNMHRKKSFMFHADRINVYSEADYVTKFWSHIFETFFGDDENLFIHWGDTQSDTIKSNNLCMRLDMRFLITKQGKVVMDGASCEYAAKAVKGKLYKDKIKLALGADIY